MRINNQAFELPPPRIAGNVTLEDALRFRRSVREYSNQPLKLVELSQLLWAAQGITDRRGFRTAPSAGALYPLELHVAAGNVDGLVQGVYWYDSVRHSLLSTVQGDVRGDLMAASLWQSWIGRGAAVIVIAAVYERTTMKYGQRGTRYVHIEVGHAAQNIFLQAVSLNLSTVTVGAFDDYKVAEILNMPMDERPLMLMPVGRT